MRVFFVCAFILLFLFFGGCYIGCYLNNVSDLMFLTEKAFFQHFISKNDGSRVALVAGISKSDLSNLKFCNINHL